MQFFATQTRFTLDFSRFETDIKTVDDDSLTVAEAVKVVNAEIGDEEDTIGDNVVKAMGIAAELNEKEADGIFDREDTVGPVFSVAEGKGKDDGFDRSRNEAGSQAAQLRKGSRTARHPLRTARREIRRIRKDRLYIGRFFVRGRSGRMIHHRMCYIMMV